MLSQSKGGGGGVGSDGLAHGGAFAVAFCVLCGRFPRDGNHGKHEQQQGLHDRALSNRSTIRVDRLRATSGFDQSPLSETRRPANRSEEHTSELQSHLNLVCRLLLEKKKIQIKNSEPMTN